MFNDIISIIQTLLYPYPLKRIYLVFTAIILMNITIFGLNILYRQYQNYPAPVIKVSEPLNYFTTETSSILVQGTVKPSSSRISVNAKSVYLNGDGSFSQIISINEGINSINIQAENFGKKSTLVRLVSRVPSTRQLALLKEQQLKSEQEIKLKAEQLSQIHTPSNSESVLAAESLTNADFEDTEISQLGPIEILEEQKVKSGNSTIITGRIQNKTGYTVRYLKVRAVFKNDDGIPIETQEGAVTDPDLLLAPNAVISFTVPATAKDFMGSDIDFSYEIVR